MQPKTPFRVLLLEDNPGDARLIQIMLRESPDSVDRAQAPTVSTASSLQDALRLLGEQSFDVILTDLGLPDAEGLPVVLALRDRAPETPIVVLSGRDDRASAIQAVKEGAQDYLIKGQAEAPVLHRALYYAVERKRIEVERAHLLNREREARALAEAAVRTRDQVLSTVTHDLRTPLAAISVYAQSLPERVDRDAALRPILDELGRKIGQAAKDGLTMIEELLDVARLTMGEELTLHRRPLSVADFVREAVDSYAALATDHVVTVDVPPEAVSARWDEARLRRVLNNLLSNAAKYSRAGTQVHVRLSYDSDGARTWVLIAVTDEGTGISEADLPRLFDWFWRGENVRGRRGSGLGLAGVRRIVELHGGTIDVRSEINVGSTFEVRLPLGV
jgi:signal transduction histidine kinase